MTALGGAAGKQIHNVNQQQALSALHLALLGIKFKDYFPQTVPSLAPHLIIAGLVPAIFSGLATDARDEPGHDEIWGTVAEFGAATAYRWLTIQSGLIHGSWFEGASG